MPFGLDDVNAALDTTKKSGDIFGDLFGGLFKKDPRIQADNKTMQSYLNALKQLNQALQDDRKTGKAGACIGLSADQLDQLAASMEAAVQGTLDAFQHPSHFQNNEAFEIGRQTAAGLRQRAQAKRSKCGSGSSLNSESLIGLGAAAVGGFLLFFKR